MFYLQLLQNGEYAGRNCIIIRVYCKPPIDKVRVADVPNEVPSTSPHFTEIEDRFINMNEDMMCPLSFNYSLIKKPGM